MVILRLKKKKEELQATPFVVDDFNRAGWGLHIIRACIFCIVRFMYVPTLGTYI